MKTKHPERVKLSKALEEDRERIKSRKGNIDKRATIIKGEGDSESTGEASGVSQPTTEQLARINQFTRSPKTAEELAVFTTLSCNDLPDRDDDQFTKECISDFASLEAPFSSVGKSFMLDHAYSVQNAVGRIFGVGTEKVSGANFLTNEVYVPNTESNQKLLEDIDFGINWAVSVGVVLGEDSCSLPWCGSAFSWSGWWCQSGHDKGMYYTEDAEEDAWGYPIPCEDQSGAEGQKCVRHFSQPRDFYELSQVFLGAQYYAQLAEKDPNWKGILKAASAKVPVLGLKSAEADDLPLRHLPKQVADAYSRYKVTEDESDGSLTWQDEERIIWNFDPEHPEDGVMSLGRAKAAGEEDDDDTEEVDSNGEVQLDGNAEGDLGEDPDAEARSVDQSEDGSGEGDHSEDGGVEPLGSEPGTGELVTEDAGDGDEDESESEEEDDESEDSDSENSDADDSDSEEKTIKGVQDVLKAAIGADLPSEITAVLAEAKGTGLEALLEAASEEIKALREKNQNLSKQAELGERLVREARADAIEWYVKANFEGDGQPVKTDEYVKLLDRCGTDVDLIRSLGDKERKLAQERFGLKKTRKSSFRKDPNLDQDGKDATAEEAEQERKSLWDQEDEERRDKVVSRIHG